IAAASVRQAVFADLALAVAVVAVGAVGIRTMVLEDAGDRSTLLYLATVAALGVLARLAGERLRTIEFSPVTRVRTPVGSNAFTGEQLEALESAVGPLDLF